MSMALYSRLYGKQMKIISHLLGKRFHYFLRFAKSWEVLITCPIPPKDRAAEGSSAKNRTDFSSNFSRFLRNLEKSLEKSKIYKMKWVLKRINNAPFETGISRICRSGSPLQIREIPVRNGVFLIIFKTHFVFSHIFF